MNCFMAWTRLVQVRWRSVDVLKFTGNPPTLYCFNRVVSNNQIIKINGTVLGSVWFPGPWFIVLIHLVCLIICDRFFISFIIMLLNYNNGVIYLLTGCGGWEFWFSWCSSARVRHFSILTNSNRLLIALDLLVKFM